MAEKPADGSFSFKYFLFGEGKKDWWRSMGDGIRLGLIVVAIAGIILLALNVWNFFFPKPAQNVNRPSVIALPGSHIAEIDQTSTQVLVEDKPWEVGLGAAALQYDNKNGALVGGWARRRF